MEEYSVVDFITLIKVTEFYLALSGKAKLYNCYWVKSVPSVPVLWVTCQTIRS